LLEDLIFEETVREQKKGFCSSFKTKEALDEKFGRGMWRAMERFAILDPRPRVIDNAKKSGHNWFTRMGETIYVVNVDFVPAAARTVLLAVVGKLVQQDVSAWSWEQLQPHVPPWLMFKMGTEDLPDAYKGSAVHDSQSQCSIVAVHVPGTGWRFVEQYGLAFGLESAVVGFNRLPSLGVAVSRRMAFSLCAAYFDDEVVLEAVADTLLSKEGLKLVFTLMGSPPGPSKSIPAGQHRHYLGSALQLGLACEDGDITIQAKTSTQARVVGKLQGFLASYKLSPQEAGKLRGDLVWLGSHAYGRLGQVAVNILGDRQYSEHTVLLEADVRDLQFLIFVIGDTPPRQIHLAPSARPPLLIYSDASFHAGACRLGWVIFRPGLQPVGGTCLVPPAVLASWEGVHHIYKGELLCGLVVPSLHANLLTNTELTWFVDNEPAASTLIRGRSRTEFGSYVGLAFHLIFLKLRTRCWIEWIDSKSNPSDGLSRDGVSDVWTTQQGWAVQEYQFPSWLHESASLEQLWASLVST
jgi:hypothetical protein